MSEYVFLASGTSGQADRMIIQHVSIKTSELSFVLLRHMLVTSNLFDESRCMCLAHNSR